MFKNQTEGLKRDLYTQKGQMQTMQNLRIDTNAKFEFGTINFKVLKRMRILKLKIKKLIMTKAYLTYASKKMEVN